MSPRRRAGIGRAVFGHRLLFFVHFARLDRERHLARALVDVGDLGVDLLADGEAVGLLFGTLAGEIAALDEAGEALASSPSVTSMPSSLIALTVQVTTSPFLKPTETPSNGSS